MNRRGPSRIPERFRRRRRFGSFAGGAIGGFFGSLLNRAVKEQEEKEHTDSFEDLLKRITSSPEGAVSPVTLEEFRDLQDENLIVYEGTIPFVMGRKVIVS